MDGQNTVILRAANGNVGTSIGANHNGLAGAAGAVLQARDDITVGASGQASLQGAVQIVVIVVEGNKAAAATAEGNLVAAVVPPVLQVSIVDGIAEGNHVVDLAPTVFAHPSIAAGEIAVELRGSDVGAIGCRWSLIGVGEGEGRHHTGCAEGMSQHEGGGHLVLLGHLVGEHISATSTVSTLVVMVVDEDQRTIGSSKAPSGAPVGQITQLILAAEHFANRVRVTELSDGTQSSVFALADGLTAQIDDLLEDVGLGARVEAMGSVQIVQTVIDDLQISGPHVLGGIHTETSNTQLSQMVQEVDDLVLHPRVALVKITQTNQLTVAHIGGIVVVGDGAGGVEVQRGEGHGREALRAGVGSAATGTTGATIGSHVIEDNIHIGAHTHSIATADHAGELLLITRASGQLVGNRLVTLPPWTVGTHHVLVDGGNLQGE